MRSNAMVLCGRLTVPKRHHYIGRHQGIANALVGQQGTVGQDRYRQGRYFFYALDHGSDAAV